ncbi:MAG: DUF115 domain-containing protein [Spirochaetaceae bacterium]|jgi:hypothetical protein|nr:DUF115 domain-containing protein [Spirochaetaceae bacterium]
MTLPLVLPAASFFDRNREILQLRYPALAEKLIRGFRDDFTVERAATGDPTLSCRGIYIHSRQDPAREGLRQAESVLSENAGAPVILLGFGLGYAAEALAEKHRERILIIVERRKELFTLALEYRNLEALLSPGKAIFVIGGTGGSVTGALALLEKANSPPPVILKNRALISLSPEDQSWYADAERHIRTWASKGRINAATLQRFGRRWTKNLGANLSGTVRFPGVRGLARILEDRGIPVFLAAAGPSLNGLGPFLREISRRCVTVTVDTSLRFFLHRDVIPHFTVSVDPQYWNTRHLHRANSAGAALIAESAVYPSVLREKNFRRIFFCRSLFPLGRFIEDRTDPKGALGAGGSVATTAWDFARLLGPAEIWIAALDLGFPGRQTHFKGALFEENAHAGSRRFLPVETLSLQSLESGYPFPVKAADGSMVLTDRRLSLYAAWFENRLSQEKNIPNYSLSPQGVSIPGLINADIEQLLTLPPRQEEINRILNDAYSRIDGDFFAPEEQKGRERRYAEALECLIRGLEDIRNQADEAGQWAARGCEKYAAGTGGKKAAGEIEKLLSKLDMVNRSISESPVKEAAGFLFPPAGDLEKQLQNRGDPLLYHLEFCALFYRSLAAAVHFTLKTLRANFPVKEPQNSTDN